MNAAETAATSVAFESVANENELRVGTPVIIIKHLVSWKEFKYVNP